MKPIGFGRIVIYVLAIFLPALGLSSLVWSQCYTGLFRDRIFVAVAFGNFVASLIGGLALAWQRGRRR